MGKKLDKQDKSLACQTNNNKKKSLIFSAFDAQGIEDGGAGGVTHRAAVASAWTEVSK